MNETVMATKELTLQSRTQKTNSGRRQNEIKTIIEVMSKLLWEHRSTIYFNEGRKIK